MRNVAIKQNELEGVYLGISKKDGVVILDTFDTFEERKNCNAITTAKVGNGMSFMAKKMILAEISRKENESKHFVVIDPKGIPTTC